MLFDFVNGFVSFLVCLIVAILWPLTHYMYYALGHLTHHHLMGGYQTNTWQYYGIMSHIRGVSVSGWDACMGGLA